MSVCQGLAGQKRGMTATGHRVSLWGDENVLKLDSGDSFTALQIYKKPLDCTL